MTAYEFAQLLNELPDELIAPQVQAEPRQIRRMIPAVSALAAVLLLVIAAALYPRLRGNLPAIEPETTTAAVTEETEPGTAPESTATVTRTDAVTGKTAAVTVPAEIAERTATATKDTSVPKDTKVSQGTSVSRETVVSKNPSVSQGTSLTDSVPHSEVTDSVPHSEVTDTLPATEVTDTGSQNSTGAENTECATTAGQNATGTALGTDTTDTMEIICKKLQPAVITDAEGRRPVFEPLSTALFRDEIPEGVQDAPEVRFATEDCLMLQFRTVSGDAALGSLTVDAEGRLNIWLYLAPEPADRAVREFTVFAVLPKSLALSGEMQIHEILLRRQTDYDAETERLRPGCVSLTDLRSK